MDKFKRYSESEINKINYLFLNSTLKVEEIAEKLDRPYSSIVDTIYSKLRLTRPKIIKTQIFKKINNGKNNAMWKGNKVKYRALHEWIQNHKPKSKICENCKINPPYELANISGEYKRDVNDFEWLCRSCHSKQHRGKEWHQKMYQLRVQKAQS